MTNPGSTHSFILISYNGLLGISVASMDFDLIVATPMGDSVKANKILWDWLVMIGYREISIDLVLLDFKDFDLI